MHNIKTLLPLFFLSLIPLSCGSSDHLGFSLSNNFAKYWFQGKAEITSYDLEQARYGEIHKGHAVLIFVTEDFSQAKQVKLDNPEEAENDAVKVLKLNFTKKFTTGIYPYSMMASVFTPLDKEKFPNTLKVAASSQEWCGHTFTQLNLKENRYDAQLYSYFEKEGDQQLSLPKVLLEDEVWNMIRLSPESLPQGEIQLIPGTLYQRLSHKNLEPKKAKALLSDHPTDEDLRTYIIDYSESDHSLTIYFNRKFPHEIQGWEEAVVSGFGESAKALTTKATLRERMMIDYWTKNNPDDRELRDKLGLGAN